MNPITVFFGYITWHYGSALVDILRVWGNFMWFVLHFFSTFTLIKTFLSPWRRLHEVYKKGLDPGQLAGTFIVNTLMRMVGIIARSIFIILSLFLFSVTWFIGVCFIAFWVVAPVGIVLIFLHGLSLL